MSEQVLRGIRKDINKIIDEASERPSQRSSAGALRAAKCMAELLEAAKAVVAEFIKMSGRIEETPLNIQQLEQAIGKAERGT